MTTANLRKRIAILAVVLELIAFWFERVPVSHFAAIFLPPPQGAIAQQWGGSQNGSATFLIVPVDDLVPPYIQQDRNSFVSLAAGRETIRRIKFSKTVRDEAFRKLADEIALEVDDGVYGLPKSDCHYAGTVNLSRAADMLLVSGSRSDLVKAQRVIAGVRLRHTLSQTLWNHWLAACGATAACWLFIAYIRRPRPGHCRKCGYDLRASPTCCPECGTLIKGTSSVALIAQVSPFLRPRPADVS